MGKWTTIRSSSAADRPVPCWPTVSRRAAATLSCCAKPGRTSAEDNVPPEIADSYPGIAYFDPRFHWTELKVRTQPLSHNNPTDLPPLRKYEQARVLGGGSSINGQLANRGAPTDYDEWEARGAAGWGWDDVLPYFRKLERDLDCDGPLSRQGWAHSLSGAFHANNGARMRSRPRRRSSRRAADTCPTRTGCSRMDIFAITISNQDERRVSAAFGYLDRATRARPNLTISTDTAVRGLLFDGPVCIGVRAVVGGREVEYRGREIILCTGAIHTPAHLLRAGIGPAGDLRGLGIDVRANLPGVGDATDGPSRRSGLPRSSIGGRAWTDRTRRHIHVAMRYSSALPARPPGDMFVACASKSAWHAVGEQIGSLILFVNKTYSESGRVQLASPDPDVEPIVDFNLLSDSRDVERLMDGFRRLGALQQSAPLREVTSDPFPASYSDRVRRIGNREHEKSSIDNAGVAKLLDGPAVLRAS